MEAKQLTYLRCYIALNTLNIRDKRQNQHFRNHSLLNKINSLYDYVTATTDVLTSHVTEIPTHFNISI